MKQEYLVKQFSSSSIEELLNNSNVNEDRHSWLLSYLDVFVLIIMLVITLMAISDFTMPETHQKSKPNISSNEKTSPLKTNTTAIKNSTIDQPIVKNQIQKKNPTQISHNPTNAQTKKITEPLKLKKKSVPHPGKSDLNALATSARGVNPKTDLLAGLNSTGSQASLFETEKTASPSPKTKLQDYWQKQLNDKLTNLELNEFVSINVKQGYAQIEIQDNILFESAEAELTADGEIVLQRLISILKQSAGLIFIEGHTDNQPINTEKFPSNWELGSARATSVLHFLASQQLNQSRLRAVTYADTMPIADNATTAGRRKNRRVNILIKIPETKPIE
jgi:chemotaxis protein MotB